MEILSLIRIDRSFDTLMVWCLFGTVKPNEHAIIKLPFTILMILVQALIFFSSEYAPFLMVHLKGKADLMSALIPLALRVKMISQWTFQTPKIALSSDFISDYSP